MEGSQFTQGEELAVEDPFGENGMGDFSQDVDPFAESDALAPGEEKPEEEKQPEGALPVVTKEGEVVGDALDDRQGASEALPAAEVGTDGQPIEKLPADPTPGQTGPDGEALTAQEGMPPPTAAAVPSEASGGSTPSATAEGNSATTAGAESEQSAKSKRPSGNRSGYVLLIPDGEKFTRLKWKADKNGNVVKEGGKATDVATVSNKREALAIGYAALGEPEGGAKLVAIPAGFFEIKTVEPDSQPIRRRPLKIR